jgi:hypothetical protein
MSKSIYSCVVEGDPICDDAPVARRLLLDAHRNLKDLSEILGTIKAREDEEYGLGYLIGQVEAARSILATHITTDYRATLRGAAGTNG